MAGSADITGRQNYVQGIGHPKTTPSTEAAPAMLVANPQIGVTGLIGPDGVSIGIGARQPKPTNTLTRKTFGVSSTSSQSTAFTYCQKEAVEAGFDAIRLVYHHHAATTPTLAAIVAATETSKTDTVDNLFEPIANGTKFQQKDSTTSPYGWRTVTWAGASTKTLLADGAQQRPALYASDWIPLQSVPRASGEESTLPLVMVRCYVSNAAAQNFTVGAANSLMRTSTADNTGRILQSGAYLGDGVGTISDANRPGSLASSHIPFAIQYRTRARGLSVIAIGDSITQGTPGATDAMSSWVLRACALASSSTKPVSAWNCGSASQNGTVFTTAGNDALAVGGVNVVVYSAFTPNDYSSPTAGQMSYLITQMMGRTQAMIDYCQANRLALVVWTGIPNISGLSAAADAVRKSYNDALRAMASTSKTFFLFDADAIVSDGASPANMVAAYNLDNIHPNNAGIAAIASGLAAVLSQIPNN
jgi:lysophospholipase L1-like esterase